MRDVGKQLAHSRASKRLRSTVHNGVQSLQYTLDYELRNAERSRRFVAIVRLGTSAEGITLADCLAGTVRASDEHVWSGDGATVVMSETTEREALVAVGRYAAAMKGKADLWFGIAAFPRDGHEARQLLSVAEDRFEKARQKTSGGVV